MHDEMHITNYNKLSTKIREFIKKQSWFQQHGIELLKMSLRFALFFAGFFVFALGFWALKISGLFIMAYAYTGIAISGIHQASHRSLVKGIWGNKLWGYFFTDFWVAKSSKWWYDRHIVIHHPHPNDPQKEPKPFYFPWINRYVYFFIIPYFAIPWFIFSSINHLKKNAKELVIYLSLSAFGIVAFVGLFASQGYSILASLGFTWIVRSIFAPIFMHLAVFNHIGLSNPKPAKKWIEQQTLTTRNIKPALFLKGMGGNAFLHGHLEHHLFPRLSNHMIEKTRPILIEHLKLEGYEYKEEGYFSCLKHCLKNYHLLFKDLPEALW